MDPLNRRRLLGLGLLFADTTRRALAQSETVAKRRPKADPTATVSDPGRIRVDARQVLVPVVVTDDRGQVVTGLTQGDFSIQLDGKQGPRVQPTSLVAEDGPIEIHILFDASASMKRMKEGAVASLAEALHGGTTEDEYGLTVFQGKFQPNVVRVVNPEDLDELEKIGRSIEPKGWTPLNDAIMDSLKRFKKDDKRKVILILSDGDNNYSRHHDGEVHRALREANARVFAMSVGYANKALAQFAEDSGGLALMAKNMDDVAPTAQRLNRLMRHMNVLTFAANDSGDGKYHRIQVRVKKPEGTTFVTVTARPGYYATPDGAAPGRR